MRIIIPGIHTLVQHIKQRKENPESYRPQRCCHCGQAGLRFHGHYPRKADREHTGEQSLNPIMIPRFYCPNCRHTCSVLPECIPPRRWYLWEIQKIVLFLTVQGHSFCQVSLNHVPSRWTISRWANWLADNFEQHAFHLRAQIASLGYTNGLREFWGACIKRFSFGHAMYLLNQAGVLVP